MFVRDPKGTSRFATIQSPIPQAIYRHYGLDADSFDTFMVLLERRALHALGGDAGRGAHHAGAMAVARDTSAALFRVSSATGSTTGCSAIALRGLEASEQCFMPDVAQRARFLPDAPVVEPPRLALPRALEL